MKEYFWLIFGDCVCLLTGIIMLVIQNTSHETIIGGILVSLSCAGAFWIGLHRGKEVAKKKMEAEQS
jgi:hypothetical protein